MNKTEAKNRIEKLKKEIDFHRYNYHVLDKETMPPAALDSLKNELFKLEQQFPDLITPDSPTQRVGGAPLDKFRKVEHYKQMLSLFDAFSEEDMRDWETRVLNYAASIGWHLPPPEYYCELKLDGLAINLKYLDGLLIQGSTRGDGKVGEDVTQNIKTIESIPLKLKVAAPGVVEVRGEAIMPKSVLEKLNKKYARAGKALLANTRNGAAGSIRQLDSRVTAERQLVFYEYDYIAAAKPGGTDASSDLAAKTRFEADAVCRKLGFKTVAYNKTVNSLEEVFAFHHYWETHRDKLDFNIDGVVVKFNRLDLWDKLGIVGKAPRFAMAYKFPALQATTRVLDVIWQVGRTGILTPTAVLEPVNVGGAVISRATLHNMDEIGRLKLKIGDTIILERAGDVIPKVVKALPNLRNGREKNISVPKKCPICESPVARVPGEVAYRCTNKRCYAVALRSLGHFVSKGAIDIDGLGPKIIEQLVNAGLIRDFADIYSLEKTDLENLERFAEKSADNLIAAIDGRREVELARFLNALGIRHIGEESAQVLAQFILERLKGGPRKNVKISELIKFFETISAADLNAVEDFGPIVSRSIYDFWRDRHNLKILEKLEKNGVILKVEKVRVSAKNKDIYGKTFVLTGSLSSLTRDGAKDKIRGLGGKTAESVGKKVDYVVVGADPGSKFEQARKLGIKTINESEFIKMLK